MAVHRVVTGGEGSQVHLRNQVVELVVDDRRREARTQRNLNDTQMYQETPRVKLLMVMVNINPL